MKQNEDFLSTLREQYGEKIQATYLSCEHDEGIDYTRLSQELTKMKRAAKMDGLPENEYWDLVKSTIPGGWEKIKRP